MRGGGGVGGGCGRRRWGDGGLSLGLCLCLIDFAAERQALIAFKQASDGIHCSRRLLRL